MYLFYVNMFFSEMEEHDRSDIRDWRYLFDYYVTFEDELRALHEVTYAL